MSVDLVLSRLDSPRQNGRDRWRAACPVCGGKNRSTLSVGAGDTGAVLLKCWKSGCDPEAIALALGLELVDLFPPRDSSGPPMERRALITARQALDLLQTEAMVLFVVGSDMHAQKRISGVDHDRLCEAVRSIQAMAQEVYA